MLIQIQFFIQINFREMINIKTFVDFQENITSWALFRSELNDIWMDVQQWISNCLIVDTIWFDLM